MGDVENVSSGLSLLKSNCDCGKNLSLLGASVSESVKWKNVLRVSESSNAPGLFYAAFWFLLPRRNEDQELREGMTDSPPNT